MIKIKDRNKTVLITGVTGQDGAYLTKLLLEKDYTVWGTTRNKGKANLVNFKKLLIEKQINLLETDCLDFENLKEIFNQIKPDLVFHLACQSSVGLSFKYPYQTISSTVISTLNILECIRNMKKQIKLFHAASSECFGDVNIDNPANEISPIKPMSPYASGKASACLLAKNYRDTYKLFISIGFMSNHESPLRGENYVIPKLIRELNEIKNKKRDKIVFGDLSVIRDWGWAPSYVEAMYKIINDTYPDDYVISSGKSYELEAIVKRAFELLNIKDYKKYIVSSQNIRPSEIRSTYMDPSKIENKLKWIHPYNLDEILLKLIKGDYF